MTLVKPLFITFEGAEASGKSTQIKLLHEFFNSLRVSSVTTREPGGCEAAEKIRTLLLDNSNNLAKKTELVLHIAARNEHVQNFILPNLQKERTVICDRFLDSTIAYQGYGHGTAVSLINELHLNIIGSIYPDLTIILDTDTKVMYSRLKSRGLILDRYETMDKEFHERVIEGYRQLATNTQRKYLVIDGRLPSDKVFAKIESYLKENYKLT